MYPQQQPAARAQSCHDSLQGSELQGLVEIGEDQVPAENEVELAVGQLCAYVLPEEAHHRLILRLQTVITLSGYEGGIVVSIINALNVPLKYIGVGEDINDLQVFNTEKFVDALFE